MSPESFVQPVFAKAAARRQEFGEVIINFRKLRTKNSLPVCSAGEHRTASDKA